MAIWQWDIWLIPKRELEKHFAVIPEYLDLEWFETIDWWRSANLKTFETFFDTLLPRYDSPGSQHCQSWGGDDEYRITVMVEDDKVTDVGIRIDLRNLNWTLLTALIDFCRENDLWFFTLDTNKFVKPDLRKLLENLSSSRKMTFVKDPERFFKDKSYFEKLNRGTHRKYKSN